MKQNRKNPAGRAAFCGVLGALSVVLLYLGSLSVLDLSAIVVCAVLTMIVKIELGSGGWPWGYVAATGVLALLLLPSRLMAVEYILAGGVYPLVKAGFEKLHPVAGWALKLSLLDCMVLLEILITRFLLVSETPRVDLTVPAILLATAFAVLFDLALTVFISAYILKIRKRLGLKKLF